MPTKDPIKRREINQRHYQRHKASVKAAVRTRQNNLRQLVNELKNVACLDCNKTFPSYVMDFDHLRDKKFTMARAFKTGSKKLIEEEVAKCEVVCSNCHRIRTHQRRCKGCAACLQNKR